MRAFLITYSSSKIGHRAALVFAASKRAALKADKFPTGSRVQEVAHLNTSEVLVLRVEGDIPAEWMPQPSGADSQREAEADVKAALDRSHPERSENKKHRPRS